MPTITVTRATNGRKNLTETLGARIGPFAITRPLKSTCKTHWSVTHEGCGLRITQGINTLAECKRIARAIISISAAIGLDWSEVGDDGSMSKDFTALAKSLVLHVRDWHSMPLRVEDFLAVPGVRVLISRHRLA